MNCAISHPRRLLAAMCGLVLSAASGCGNDLDQQFVLEHPGELHPVAGKVYFNGKPVQGAIVTFFPASPTAQAGNLVHDQAAATHASHHGRTGPDGTYEIDSPGPGVPVGEYLVTVSWKGLSATGPGANHPPEQLPQKYQDPATSGLKATVKPGDNLIPTFDLN